MIRMRGTELSKKEYENFKDGLDRYVDIEGKDGRLVNIPTMTTGINEDGTIRQEKTEPYAFEIIGRDRRITD